METVEYQGRESGKMESRNYAEMSDEDLFITYRDTRDSNAFDTLFLRYKKELFAFLRRYTGNVTIAEDAYQEAFLQASLHSDVFIDGKKFRPWLYTIATNKAIDGQRRNRRHRMASIDREFDLSDGESVALKGILMGSESVASAGLETQESIQQMQSALNGLSPDLLKVIELVDLQSLKYCQAAEQLGVPIGTIKSRRYVAIQKLQKILSRVA